MSPRWHGISSSGPPGHMQWCVCWGYLLLVNEISRSDPIWDRWTLQPVCVFLKLKLYLYNMEFKLFAYFMESTCSDFFISGWKFNRGTLCPLLIGAMGWWRQASVCSAKGRIRGHLKQNLFNKAPFTSVPLSFWWNRKDKEQTHEIHTWIHDDLWTSCTLLLWPPFGPNNKRGDPSPRESERARDGDFAQTLEYVTTGAAAFHCLVFIQYTPAKTFNKQTWQCCPNTNG